mgnify:CR=1 FL=1
MSIKAAKITGTPFILILLLIATPVQSHEFWLETSNYQPKIAEKLPITLHLGEFFNGVSLPYLRDEFVLFQTYTGNTIKSVNGLDGDLPATTLTVSQPELTLVTYRSTPSSIKFEEWDKFESYLQNQGLEHVIQSHTISGKPTKNITELYERNAKLLIGVGAVGRDRKTGLPLEIVVEGYSPVLGRGSAISVRLFYNGKPLAGSQITAFAKAKPNHPLNVRTDATGRAKIQLPHSGAWLLNSVHMVAPSVAQNVHWYSYWASLVFFRP